MSFAIKGYEVLQDQELKELESQGVVLRHLKSGARVVVIKNEDDNKVFSIGFRTPPKNSTGVPHIIEHTVLCGSKEFPAKDPFIELVKGSLNTFLNAMTYPDKTVYPVASMNDKDFANLMHVYLDAVFYPNIYKKEEIFKQEGWHYELEDEAGELVINGVVYNEMKGAFSSPEQILYRCIQQVMFPDTPYGVESGGDPAFIPELSYEEFLAFHKTYYHASNSYIYLYGNIDVKERLTWLDERYLSHFDQTDVDSVIKIQNSFETMKEVSANYSIGEEESEEGKTYLSYNLVIGTSLEERLSLAMQVLEYTLLTAPGAPLKQALLDAGIGKDILSSYDGSILQPIFSIIAKNTDISKKEVFIKTIRETLSDLAEHGLSRRTLEGAINNYEFKYREADFGQFPKGLMYGLQILDSWLYQDENPFTHICAEDTFAFLRQSIGTGYYEKLIRTYFLDNTHCALVVVKPEKGLTDKREALLKEKLAGYKGTLSKEEIVRLIEDTKKLHEYEMTPSTKEETEKIPLLTREDIGTNIRPLNNLEKDLKGVSVLHHKMHTNKIGYLRIASDITSYAKAAPYLSLLSTILGLVDTKEFSFLELSNEVNLKTGGISFDINIYNKADFSGEYRAFFELKTKMLYSQTKDALYLIREVLTNSIFTDEKRLKEILSETRSRIEMRLESKGHVTAVDRAMSYFSESAVFEEYLTGIEFYDFIVDLDDKFEEKKNDLIKELKKWLGCLFVKESLLISYTADDEGYQILAKEFELLLPVFEHSVSMEVLDDRKELCPIRKNEGFKTPGQVQYVARCGSFSNSGMEYTGVLRVLKVILSYDYLWNHIRVKGGAYGCMCGFTMYGNGYFTSYRDPNLRETETVYQGLEAYVKQFAANERDMTKYVIGAISSMDTPLNPSAAGARSYVAYINGVTEDMIQLERDQVLSCQVSSIQNTSVIVKAIVDSGYICTIGNAAKIEAAKELFLVTKNLTK